VFAEKKKASLILQEELDVYDYQQRKSFVVNFIENVARTDLPTLKKFP
jgi:hypothetical protein